MKKENWVEMWDFPTYEISSLGNVRRTESKRPLKIRGDGNGYNVVCIFYLGRKYTKRVGMCGNLSINSSVLKLLSTLTKIN